MICNICLFLPGSLHLVWYSLYPSILLQMQYFILSIAEDSPINGHLGFFRICPVVNRAARNTGVHVSFQDIHSSRYLPRSGIVGSYSSSIFSFFKETPYCLETGNRTRFQKCNIRVGHLLFDEGSSGHCQNIQFCPMTRFCHFPSYSSCRAALRRCRVSLPTLAQHF